MGLHRMARAILYRAILTKYGGNLLNDPFDEFTTRNNRWPARVSVAHHLPFIVAQCKHWFYATINASHDRNFRIIYSSFSVRERVYRSFGSHQAEIGGGDV